MWAEGKTPAYRYGEIPGAAAVSENLSFKMPSNNIMCQQ